MNDYRYLNAIYHHGIKGQQWGVRNGPPYPLGAGAKSAKEKINWVCSNFAHTQMTTNHEE